MKSCSNVACIQSNPQPLKEFYSRSDRKSGFCSQCKSCMMGSHKTYREKNKEKIKDNKKNYRIEHQEEVRVYQKYYDSSRREEKNLWERNKRKNDPNFRLAANLRRRTRGALKGYYKAGSAIRDLGCSVEFLKAYLESKFQSGMTWENYGNGPSKWNIDHIYPLSKTNLSNHEEFLKVSNYTNLQPMWYVPNIIKGNKIINKYR